MSRSARQSRVLCHELFVSAALALLISAAAATPAAADEWTAWTGIHLDAWSGAGQDGHQVLAPLSLAFDTPFWGLSWSTQYSITEGTFESHVVRLERDLHEWRAGFNFVRNASGTFAIYFSIYLTDLPDLKFDYDQTTFEE